MRIKICFCGFFMMMALASPAGAQTGPGPAAAPAETPCVPAARVFGKAICAADIAVEQNHVSAIKEQFEQQGLDSEAALKAKSRERLKDMIWSAALTHKFGEQALAPTEEEVYFYSRAFKQTLKQSHEENLASAAKIKDMLATRTYPAADKAKMEQLLQTLETSIAFYEQRERQNASMPPEFHDMVAETERGVAQAVIRDWKVSKLLYETYGGRLAIGQTGIVPVDAQAKFLAYIKGEGKLEIIDPAYKGAFDDVEKLASAAEGSLVEKDSAAAKRYFASPYWQFETPPEN